MYKKHKAKNGLSCIASSMPQMASVSLGIWIGIGGRYESEKQSGISHLVEHMLFKGTRSRTAKNLKEAIEGVGGAFNGFTSDEVTCYMVKVPSKYMKLGVDILSDMVIDPKFDPDDLARERFVVCEEIKMYRDQPADYVMDLLAQILWPGNALGRSLTGTIKTVKSFSPKDLVDFKNNNYTPANMAVIASGKVDAEELFKYSQEKFKNIKKEKVPSFKSAKVTQKEPRIKIAKGNTSQTHIAMGFRLDAMSVKERFAAKIMNVILGGNMSSRLFEELREKHGLCYDIGSSYKRHSDIGEINIHAGVDAHSAAKSVIAILDELKKLRDLGITDDELDRAKKYTMGQFQLAMEGTSTRMMWLGDRFMVHKDIPEVKNVLDWINKVTSKEIEELCDKVFTPSLVNLSMVGKITDSERNKIKKEIKKL